MVYPYSERQSPNLDPTDREPDNPRAKLDSFPTNTYSTNNSGDEDLSDDDPLDQH